MALRLRRGTDAERQLVTPVEGELLYATDTKSLYVGDGTTTGGVLIAASGDVANTLSGLLDTEIIGLSDGDVIRYDAATGEWINSQSALNFEDLLDVVHTSETNGDLVQYDGNSWVNVPAGQVVGNNVAGLTLADFNDVFYTGSLVVNDILVHDGNKFTNRSIKDFTDLILSAEGTYTITIAADDSTIMVNPNNNRFTGDLWGNLYDDFGNIIIDEFAKSAIVDIKDPTGAYTVVDNFTGDFRRGENGQIIIQGGAAPVFIGDVQGNLQGNIVNDSLEVLLDNSTGILYGDVQGSVYSDNSTQIIDGISGAIVATEWASTTNTVTFGNNDDASQSTVNINSSNERSQLNFTRSSETDLSGDTAIPYGMIRFTRNDVNGTLITGIMQARENAILVASTATGDFVNGANYFSWKEQKFGIGTINPTATLDVQGAIKPGVYADAAARDAAITSPVEGMLAFLQDTQKFVGYVSDTGLAGGGVSNSTAGWVDLY
ncbi:hypothetical protein OAA64_01540 [bacterium]|nr:hypothetical protein [bacterium]